MRYFQSRIMVFLIIIILCPVVSNNIEFSSESNLMAHMTSSQLARNSISIDAINPISIDGDSDFHTQAVSKGWDLSGSRDGSETKPYILSDFTIVATSTNAVTIKNTALWFELSNITASTFSPYHGVLLDNIKHATIKNCTITRSNSGIFINNAKQVKIYQNNITGSTFAVQMTNSNTSIISENHFENSNTYDLYLNKLNESRIEHNTMISADNFAISGEGYDLQVNHNRIDGAYNGLELTTDNSVITNNIFLQIGYGVFYVYGDGNSILANTIQEPMSISTAYILQGASNIFSWNNYIASSYATISLDAGNTIDHNYDSIFSGTDADNDYVYDDANLDLVLSYNLSRPQFISNLDGSYGYNLPLVWTNVTNTYNHTVGFDLYYRLTGSIDWLPITQNINSLSYNWDTTSLADGDYDLRLDAQTSVGKINSSIISSVTVYNELTGNIPSISAISSTNGILLHWAEADPPGSGGVVSYIINRGNDSSAIAQYDSTMKLSYLDTSVSVNANYSYFIEAIGYTGGGLSPVIQITYQTVPSQIQSVETSVSADTIELTWLSPEDGGSPITGYQLFKGQQTNVYTDNITTSSSSYVDSSVDLRHTYYYTIGAVNENGVSQNSTEVAVHASVPSVIRHVTGTVNSSGMSLSWEVPADDGGSSISEYLIYRSQTGSDYDLVFNSFTPSYSDLTADGAKSYTYLIAARNAWGVGMNSTSFKLFDATPPSISVADLDDTTNVSGNLTLNITVTDNVGVANVSVFMSGGIFGDTTKIYSSLNAPYLTSIDTASIANDNYTLIITARDPHGNRIEDSYELIVNNSDSNTFSYGLVISLSLLLVLGVIGGIRYRRIQLGS